MNEAGTLISGEEPHQSRATVRTKEKLNDDITMGIPKSTVLFYLAVSGTIRSRKLS